MKKLIKFVAVLFILVLLALIGLAIFVNTYFTDERLRAMLVPPLEQALGRTVEIGHINVSLFTGINIFDVAVKEANGEDTFFSSNRFVLSYDLVPLLNRQLVINEIRLVAPLVKISRDKDGIFNFSSLALLADKPEAKKEPVTQSQPLPISITVDKMVIENGRVEVSDATNAIPPSSLSTDISVGLDLGQQLNDISFQGDANFTLNTTYKGVKPLCVGTITFSKTRLSYSIDLAVNKDQINVYGAIENYLRNDKILPPIALSVKGRHLDINRILASLKPLSQSSSSPSGSGQKAADSKNTPLDTLQIHGQVDFTDVNYNKIIMQEIKLDYSLTKGVLRCQDIQIASLGGEIRGKMKTGLTVPQNYNGKIGIHGLQLAQLQAALGQTREMGGISGQLSSAFEFAGSGFSSERIKSNLTAHGDLDMAEVKVKATEATSSLASLLNLPELNELNMDKLAGSFTVNKGRLQLDTTLTSALLSGRIVGSMGLDGSLDLPLTLTLSPQLSQRLEERLEVAKYMEKQGEQTVVRLDVKGSLNKPDISINKKYLRQQTTNTLIDRALGDDASPEEQAAGEAVKGVLDSLFGK